MNNTGLIISCCLLISSLGCRHPAVPDEYWSSLTASDSTTIVLEGGGRAEYTKVSNLNRGESMYFVHSAEAKWGIRETSATVLIPQLPGNEPVKRYLWVSVEDRRGRFGFRLDYADVGDKLYEFDKTGIQATLYRCENGERRNIPQLR